MELEAMGPVIQRGAKPSIVVLSIMPRATAWKTRQEFCAANIAWRTLCAINEAGELNLMQ